jgi:hypothetical protein
LEAGTLRNIGSLENPRARSRYSRRKAADIVVYRRGEGSSIQAQTVGDNVGKLPWAAATGYSKDSRTRPNAEGGESPTGATHEPVRARTEGQCPPRRWHTSPQRRQTRVGQKGALATWRPPRLPGLIKPAHSQMTASGGRRGCGQTRRLEVHTNQRLSLSAAWEGLRKTGRGFKPDSGNPTLRHHRGHHRGHREPCAMVRL